MWRLYELAGSTSLNKTCFQNSMWPSEDSSEPEEFTGSPLVISNSKKFLSDEGAWDRNEAIQRYTDLLASLGHRVFRIREVADTYFKSVDEDAILDYGHQRAGMAKR